MSDVRRCTKCGEEKALAEFTANKRASQGANNWCKPCYRAYSKAYYAKTRSRRREQARTLRAANAEERNERGRMWREQNPDYDRNWYMENRNEVRARSRARYWKDPAAAIRAAVDWAKRNPAKTNARNARRHARKRGAPGRGISGAEWQQLIDDAVGVCPYCSQKTDRLEVDHIAPLALGGAHDINNAVAVCYSCNRSKKATPLLVWMARRATA